METKESMLEKENKALREENLMLKKDVAEIAMLRKKISYLEGLLKTNGIETYSL